MKPIRNFCALLLCLSILTACACEYLLTVKDGFIALWDSHNGCWNTVTDAPVSSLPARDRELLTEGIRCPDRESAVSLLEDYCS